MYASCDMRYDVIQVSHDDHLDALATSVLDELCVGYKTSIVIDNSIVPPY